MFSLQGKVALVTGCGTLEQGWGNGKAIAVLLARQGARIFGVDLHLESAEVTRKIIEDEGGEIEVMACDVTDSQQVQSMVKACIERFGKIDILINNVGRSEPGGPAEMSEEIWQDQLDVNVTSAFLTCKYVLPVMESQGSGAVVNISSVAGLQYIGKPQVGYAAGKAALMQFTKTTAVIYAKRGVRLNCVAPGLMFTPLVERLANKYAKGNYEEFVNHRHNQVPMGHMGDAWDVANAVLFLACDESRYITGQTLVVDGGITSATK